MGYASYFEDICLRDGESSVGTLCMIGPAGSVSNRLPGGNENRRRLSDGEVDDNSAKLLEQALTASYDRLRTYCCDVRDDVIENYQRGQWRDFSVQMDKREEDERAFGRKTLLASEQQFMQEAARLSGRASELITHAKSILASLDRRLRPISDELTRLQSLKQRGKVSVPSAPSAADKELETHAVWLVHGWRVLKEQTQELEDRLEKQADELEILLADDVFDRLMIGAADRIPDKDLPDD